MKYLQMFFALSYVAFWALLGFVNWQKIHAFVPISGLFICGFIGLSTLMIFFAGYENVKRHMDGPF